ncbi:MAG: hypothetical protein KDK64_06235 [Chlamydiia bacterium]|nr:hypothetical protein [Chlamydiia bacterium]
MALADPVSKPRAALDFFNSWESTLLVGGCLIYLAGRVVLPMMGKSADKYPYLAKMNDKFLTFWAFDDFARAASAGFVGYSDVKTLFDGRTNRQIREGGGANCPNDEMTLNGKRYLWVLRRSLATFLKVFSASILVHEGLRAVGATKSGPSNLLKVTGATAGFVGLGMEVYDVQQRKNDYDAHNLRNNLRKTDAHGHYATNADFDHAYKTNLSYNQAVKVLIMGVKVMALITTLSKMELTGLAGRVMKTPLMEGAVKHADHCFNGIFIGMAITLFAQKVHVGASLSKWSKDDGTWATKYFFKEFSNSREWVRIVEGTATTLLDFGYDALAETDIGALGKFAKAFDSFLYVPKVAERTGGLIDKSWELSKGITARRTWEATHAVFKLIGDTGAALKFIGAFGGIAYLSERTKMFGYVKNIFSATAAAMAIAQEVFFPKKKWEDKNEKDVFKAVMIIGASVGSFFLNGFGGMASAFGKQITKPGVSQNFKPWVYNFAKLNATVCAAFVKYASAPAA